MDKWTSQKDRTPFISFLRHKEKLSWLRYSPHQWLPLKTQVCLSQPGHSQSWCPQRLTSPSQSNRSWTETLLFDAVPSTVT